MDPDELRKPIPPPRRGVPLEAWLLSAMALATLAGFIALGFWQDLPVEHRARLVFGISLVLVGGVGILLLSGPLRRWRRERMWRRAMSAWQVNSVSRRRPPFQIPSELSESDLRELAIQTYARLGYEVGPQIAREPYIRLTNPRGQVELLACAHQPEPIRLHHVNSLHLEMVRTKAQRGFFWAMSGFTDEALEWSSHRPIVLADRDEIGRFMEAAQLRGPRYSVF